VARREREILERAVHAVTEQAANADDSVETLSTRASTCICSGLGITPGYWAHREPASHGEPAISDCG
jgi:hypothetical protein